MRYFPNRLPAYTPGQAVTADVAALKQQALDTVKSCVEKQPVSARNRDGGLYVGFVGIGYALLHMANNPVFAGERNQLLLQAKYLAEEEIKLARKSGKLDNAFILGDAGTTAFAALVNHAVGDQAQLSEMLSSYAHLGKQSRSFKWDELFVGKAGYLCGVKLLRRALGQEVIDQATLFAFCDNLVESGVRHARQSRSNAPLMYQYHDTESLGAAHGLASILLNLLQFPDWLEARPQSAQLVRASVDYMISVTPRGSASLPPDTADARHPERQREELVHWCHGAPGAVYTYARAYLVWKDAKYLDECRRCATVVWEKGLVKKGPGICHGVGGNGYVFLLLYRLTGEEIYLHNALQFAAFLNDPQFRSEARTPDCPYSLYEGWAGTACYLADLAAPSQAHFPFFEVFD